MSTQDILDKIDKLLSEVNHRVKNMWSCDPELSGIEKGKEEALTGLKDWIKEE